MCARHVLYVSCKNMSSIHMYFLHTQWDQNLYIVAVISRNIFYSFISYKFQLNELRLYHEVVRL